MAGLRTRDDIFTAFLVRNNRSTTDSFITETNLKNFYKDSVLWAASQKKWPATEGRVQTTFAAGLGPGTDEYYFEAYKQDSFRVLQIGGKRLRKLNFEDYQTFREEESDSTERVWSDFHRTVFINPNIDLTGTLVAYGQFQPIVDVTDETGVTFFSDYDDEGNEAIVEKMNSYLKQREHLIDEVVVFDHRASLKLNEVWNRVLDEQQKYQTHISTGGRFSRFDALNGTFPDRVSEDQF